MTILCYHSVEPTWESPLAVHPDDFDRHCAWLARRRRVLPLHDAVERLDGSGRLPRGMAVITLDDGFEALHTHALPIIHRYQLPTTVFLVAQTLTPVGKSVDWVRTPPPWPLRTLSVEQVLEMQSAGVDFQSHSWAHHDLPELDVDRCVKDLRDSRKLLEELLGRPVGLLAYPRGLHDERVRQAAAQAGYTHALALPEGPEQAGRYAIPRVGIYRGNGMLSLRVKSSRSYLPARNRGSHRLVRRVRRAVRTPSPR